VVDITIIGYPLSKFKCIQDSLQSVVDVESPSVRWRQSDDQGVRRLDMGMIDSQNGLGFRHPLAILLRLDYAASTDGSIEGVG